MLCLCGTSGGIMKAENYVERALAPIQRVVTPTLAELSPARLAEAVETYRRELADLANRHAFPSAAWALEAMDVLVSDNERLQREVTRLTAERRPVATRAS